MIQNIFITNINAILEDDTEVNNVSGYIINKKRVYKMNDGTILTGTKKIKNILNATILVPPELLPYIYNMEYE